jgi:LmbE family N-acetylglucosaminyl deacetylase
MTHCIIGQGHGAKELRKGSHKCQGRSRGEGHDNELGWSGDGPCGGVLLATGPLAAQGTTPADSDPEPPLVVAVLAHPDDELPIAPALAALARQGNFVRIVHATSGDAGPGVSGMPKGERLAAARRAEAQCSGKALGVAQVINLEFGDGKLADHVRDGSLAKALFDHVARADLVLTWGPDGGYGHADHRLVSALATQIAQGEPNGEQPRMLYVGIRAGTLPPVADMADWAVTDAALLTATIPYTTADLAAARAAAQCHVTQFSPAARAGMMDLFDATIWQGKVHFRPAF